MLEKQRNSLRGKKARVSGNPTPSPNLPLSGAAIRKSAAAATHSAADKNSEPVPNGIPSTTPLTSQPSLPLAATVPGIAALQAFPPGLPLSHQNSDSSLRMSDNRAGARFYRVADATIKCGRTKDGAVSQFQHIDDFTTGLSAADFQHSSSDNLTCSEKQANWSEFPIDTQDADVGPVKRNSSEQGSVCESFEKSRVEAEAVVEGAASARQQQTFFSAELSSDGHRGAVLKNPAQESNGRPGSLSKLQKHGCVFNTVKGADEEKKAAAVAMDETNSGVVGVKEKAHISKAITGEILQISDSVRVDDKALISREITAKVLQISDSSVSRGDLQQQADPEEPRRVDQGDVVERSIPEVGGTPNSNQASASETCSAAGERDSFGVGIDDGNKLPSTGKKNHQICDSSRCVDVQAEPGEETRGNPGTSGTSGEGDKDAADIPKSNEALLISASFSTDKSDSSACKKGHAAIHSNGDSENTLLSPLGKKAADEEVAKSCLQEGPSAVPHESKCAGSPCGGTRASSFKGIGNVDKQDTGNLNAVMAVVAAISAGKSVGVEDITPSTELEQGKNNAECLENDHSSRDCNAMEKINVSQERAEKESAPTTPEKCDIVDPPELRVVKREELPSCLVSAAPMGATNKVDAAPAAAAAAPRASPTFVSPNCENPGNTVGRMVFKEEQTSLSDESRETNGRVAGGCKDSSRVNGLLLPCKRVNEEKSSDDYETVSHKHKKAYSLDLLLNAVRVAHGLPLTDEKMEMDVKPAAAGGEPEELPVPKLIAESSDLEDRAGAQQSLLPPKSEAPSTMGVGGLVFCQKKVLRRARSKYKRTSTTDGGSGEASGATEGSSVCNRTDSKKNIWERDQMDVVVSHTSAPTSAEESPAAEEEMVGPLIRSKRGRAQTMPGWLRDSVVENVKKGTKPEKKPSDNQEATAKGADFATEGTVSKAKQAKPAGQQKAPAKSVAVRSESAKAPAGKLRPLLSRSHSCEEGVRGVGKVEVEALSKQSQSPSDGVPIEKGVSDLESPPLPDEEVVKGILTVNSLSSGGLHPLEEFDLGDIVWAKSGKRNDPVWPAKVIDPIKEAPEAVRAVCVPGRLCVMFFGPSLAKGRERVRRSLSTGPDVGAARGVSISCVDDASHT